MRVSTVRTVLFEFSITMRYSWTASRPAGLLVTRRAATYARAWGLIGALSMPISKVKVDICIGSKTPKIGIQASRRGSVSSPAGTHAAGWHTVDINAKAPAIVVSSASTA